MKKFDQAIATLYEEFKKLVDKSGEECETVESEVEGISEEWGCPSARDLLCHFLETKARGTKK